MELFGLVINIYAFRKLLTNVYFEVFCDHSAIPQILKGKKKLPTRRIQRLIEHLLPFNFTIHYLPGEKMHIADILSHLAGKDLEPQDKLIPISFNVMTRSQTAQLPPSSSKNINQTNVKVSTKKVKPQTMKQTSSIPLQKTKQPTKPASKMIARQPVMPIGILRKPFPSRHLPPQKEVRKSLVNPNLHIPQTLPVLDIPPPEPKESLETYRPPDSSLYDKPLPVLKDAKELDVFTRHIPKQTDIDRFLQVLKAKVTKSYKLPVTASELVKEYPQSPVFKHIYAYITKNVLPPDRRTQRIVIANAEHYVVANGILYRLVKTKKAFDSQTKCLLVVPEKFKTWLFSYVP